MSAGLCSVLESIRRSLDSDTDSDNDDDVTDDVDPPSWHGSLPHLANTPSTSESEAGNNSSESFLCDHCGRASSQGENDGRSTSGRPPFPAGRRRGCRPKKRAHFAVDTDNSSDADKMSDSHESCASNTFRPISGLTQLVLSTSRRGSLSPREIKPSSSTDNRPSPSFTRHASVTDAYRGRQPFKANHELFKLPPSGPSSTNNSPSSSAVHKNNQCSSTATSGAASTGKPALPPRQIHRNHFKLQRRNSVSNEDRKLPVQTFKGKSDGMVPPRPARCASASREMDTRNHNSDRHPQPGTRSHGNNNFQNRVHSTSDAAVLPSRDIMGNSVEQGCDFREQLPNYDEAVQRVSLLRWASLQKLPAKTFAENHQPSPNVSTSQSQSSPVEDGHVEQKVRQFESKAVSFSSGSSLSHERPNSWNPTNNGWFGSNSSSHSNSKDIECAVENTAGVADVIKVCYTNKNDSDVLCRRRDNSSTLSDDVFYHDDSRENFADISWSPVTPEDKLFLTPPISDHGHPLSPALLAVPKSRSQSINRHVVRNCNADISNTSNSNSPNVNNNSNNNSSNKSDYTGENTTATLPNGKRIVLEVLV